MTTPTYDINAAIQALRKGKDLIGEDGILSPLIKQLAKTALAAEQDGYLTWRVLVAASCPTQVEIAIKHVNKLKDHNSILCDIRFESTDNYNSI